MAASTSNVYQFKITLKGCKPKVWRRIQVPDKYSFFDLHVAIQDAMGWGDCHLHKFEMVNPKTAKMAEIATPFDSGHSEDLDFLYANRVPEKTTKIAEYFVSAKDKAYYEYDFGAGWEHQVLLEKIVPAITGSQYPQCLAGKQACPPEDGGDSDDEGDFEEIFFDPKSVKFNNPEERHSY